MGANRVRPAVIAVAAAAAAALGPLGTGAAAAEKLALFDAYTAYFGRWRVDPVRGVVLHEVEGDVADVFIGRSESRPLELDADRLILAPCWDSGGTHRCGRRVFRRVTPAAP